MLWVLGFAALFLMVLSALTRFTDVEFIEVVTAMNSIGILVAICVGGVFRVSPEFSLCRLNSIN